MDDIQTVYLILAFFCGLFFLLFFTLTERISILEDLVKNLERKM